MAAKKKVWLKRLFCLSDIELSGHHYFSNTGSTVQSFGMQSIKCEFDAF